MTTWGGHKPVTRRALVQLLTNAHVGTTRFSQSQRVLFTACEFWAACRNPALFDHLADDMNSRLLEGQLSFDMIGLPKTAAILAHARQQLTLDSAVPLELVVEGIQNALAVNEPVDDTIELFAQREL
jgi:hypothetical protein